MATIRLLQYNNYYNRIVKSEDSINEYATHVCTNDEGAEACFSQTNFIVHDGVDTTYTANWKGPTPDYLLVTNEDDREIISRWFVVEANYSAVGQYVLTLHRDLVVDFYNDVVNAPTFIEKATLPANDPFIFNSENIEFNQIKKQETLIEDDLSPKGVAWLCGYVAADANISDIEIPDIGAVDIDGESNIPLKKYLDKPLFNMDNQLEYGYRARLEFVLKLNNSSTVTSQYEVSFTVSGQSVATRNIVKLPYDAAATDMFTIYYTQVIDAQEYFNDSKKLIKNILNKYVIIDNELTFELPQQYWNNALGENNRKFILSTESLELQNQVGKIVAISGSGKTVYKKIAYAKTEEFSEMAVEITKQSALYNKFVSQLNNIPHNTNYPIGSKPLKLWNKPYTSSEKLYKYYLTDASIGVVKKLNLSNRGHLSDQPYDMLIIPYAINGSVDIKTNTDTIACSKDIAISTAMEIVRTQGIKIYDMQLLPYCPMREIFSKDSQGNNIIDISKYMSRVSIIFDNDGVSKKGVVLYPTISRSSFTISYNGYPEREENAVEKKVKTLTKMHRICSPGYNSIFEFNAEKNGGIPGFNVTCDFKPISPFIHVSPVFGELYGRDYKDMRGLTCSEDFSITRVEDAFVDYELRNKNYQQIFNREIQNMEDTHEIRQRKGFYDTIINSAGAGVVAGTSAVGGAGAGIGAAGKTAIGGLLNIGFNAHLHQLDLDYKKDKFGYQLDNIRALPNTIAKISAFCQNNKIFPVLEEYGATEVEEQALRDKLKYNGMSVHRIGTIREFLDPADKHWIQGTVIRLNNLVEDYHLSYAIALEINNGVYI